MLAQRAGVEDYHLDDLLHPGAIEAINEFAWRDALFMDSGRRRTERYIVLAEEEGDFLSESSVPLDNPNHPTIHRQHHSPPIHPSIHPH